jgi:hypothetical protein
MLIVTWKLNKCNEGGDMFHKLGFRLNVVVAAFLATGAVLAMSASPAYAYPQSLSWCNPDFDTSGTADCINEWGYGTSAKLYVSSSYQYSDWFSLIDAGSGYSALEITSGSGPYSGECLGDYGNSSSNASGGFDTCPGSGTAGWGTLLTATSCTDGTEYGYYLYDHRWGGYVTPSTFTNGAKIYLNSQTPTCWLNYAQD